MERKALEGIKILDFTWVAAGPLTTIPFAKYGATVLKVESMKKPDGVRATPPFLKSKTGGPNRSLNFSNDNANKYSMCLNLKSEEGREIAKELVKWADVVAENMRPGAMDRMGLGYDVLKEINPGIIMFRSSMNGQTGPESTLAATGTELQGYSGFTNLTGFPDKPPVLPYGAYTDLIVPSLGVGMICAALAYRDKTGKGQMLDLSQNEAALQYLTPAFLDYSVNNVVETRNGNKCDYACPHGVYQCAGDDRWVTICVFNEDEWKSLVNVMGNPAWASDPKFATLVDRKHNEDELNELITEWTKTKTNEDIMTELQAAGVDSGCVWTAADIFTEPQMVERGYLTKLEIDDDVFMSHQGLSYQMNKTPYATTKVGPSIGEDTDYVVQNILKMDDDEFVELYAKGVFD